MYKIPDPGSGSPYCWVSLPPPPPTSTNDNQPSLHIIRSSSFLAALTWAVNFITLILTGGPSITLPVQWDALDGATATSELPWDAAQFCKTQGEGS